MQAKAQLNHARISPRKVKVVLDLIRNQEYAKSMAIVKNTRKAASPLVEKLLKSAAANAENNHHMDVSKLYVAETYVCPGPTLKRIMARDHGKAFQILKRTSHITVVLKEKE